MKVKKVKKAVIAAAGMGTRFLPQTKAMPKEMLPIIDKPIIQKIVEDAVSAGVEDIIIVTSSKKRAIEDHFDADINLVTKLEISGKKEAANKVKEIAAMANFVYIRQKSEHYGTAVPLINATHLLDDEPFYYFFADDYFDCEIPATKQMLKSYQETGMSVLPLHKIERAESEKFGVVAIDETTTDKTVKVKNIIEKPKPENAPSEYASVHGYLFNPDILKLIPKTPISARGELEIQWAINELAKDDKVYGVKIDGQWRDAGNKQGYVLAIIENALADKELGIPVRRYLEKRLKQK